MNRIFRLTRVEPDKLFYEPICDVYTMAIGPDGRMELKRIESFSVHKMTQTYRIEHKLFGSFLATEDHSLIVYDAKQNKTVKMSPKEILERESLDDLYFVYLPLDSIDINESYNIDDAILIPLSEVSIKKDDIRDTYDFTVQDYQTFAINNGLFVQDTVAVYMPLTVEAQKEAKQKMFRKTKSVATGGSLFELSQGMILGLYLLTKDDRPSKQISFRPKSFDFEYLFNLIKEDPDYAYIDVVYNGPKTDRPIKTTLGRVLVNQAIPNQVPFFDFVWRKKNIKKVFDTSVKYLDDNEMIVTYDKLRTLGFEAASRFAISLPIDEMKIPLDLKKEAEKLKEMDPDSGMKYINNVLLPKLKEYVKKHYPQVYAIFDSGARGSWSDLMQMVLVKGYVEDAEGKVVKVPVAKGFVDNLNAIEAFIISPTARAGIANRSIRTAEGGYLTRRLVKAAANIKINFNLKDCKTDRFLEIKIKDEDWAKAVIGRYLADGTLITDENYKDLIGQTIQLRSPIFCKSEKICLTCYGELHKLLTSDNIGTQSAQIVGERGTQLIMKTFHTGGLAETKGIPQIIEKDNPNIKQEKMSIIVERPCKVVISKETADYKLFEDRVVLQSGLAVIYFKDGTYYEIDLQEGDYAIEFKNFLDMKSDEHGVKLLYDAGQEIGELELMSETFGLVLQRANRLFERRACKDCDISKTLEEIFELYKSTGRKLIHFEVVLSNMVRAKSNLYVPFRLSNDKEYTIIGISQVPFYTSPLLALAFQNVGKAIETGLLAPDDIKVGETEFEKILLGEFTKEK